jgi:hypothetical protein
LIGNGEAWLKLRREVTLQAIDTFVVPVVAEGESKVLWYAEICSRDNRHMRPQKDVAR